jgi:two-component system, response regulator PdtaR
MALEPKPVVLVVEDEPLVRAMAADVLEEAGFEVVEAPTADYALTVLAKRPDVRVVFTDVEMPGHLNGFELARAVQDYYHHVGVVIGSGRAAPQAGDMAPDAVFIRKPYLPATLVQAVQRQIALRSRQ